MKNIINAVEAFDFIVKKITIKMGIKIGTIELLNVYLYLTLNYELTIILS